MAEKTKTFKETIIDRIDTENNKTTETVITTTKTKINEVEAAIRTAEGLITQYTREGDVENAITKKAVKESKEHELKLLKSYLNEIVYVPPISLGTYNALANEIKSHYPGLRKAKYEALKDLLDQAKTVAESLQDLIDEEDDLLGYLYSVSDASKNRFGGYTGYSMTRMPEIVEQTFINNTGIGSIRNVVENQIWLLEH